MKQLIFASLFLTYGLAQAQVSPNYLVKFDAELQYARGKKVKSTQDFDFSVAYSADGRICRVLDAAGEIEHYRTNGCTVLTDQNGKAIQIELNQIFAQDTIKALHYSFFNSTGRCRQGRLLGRAKSATIDLSKNNQIIQLAKHKRKTMSVRIFGSTEQQVAMKSLKLDLADFSSMENDQAMINIGNSNSNYPKNCIDVAQTLNEKNLPGSFGSYGLFSCEVSPRRGASGLNLLVFNTIVPDTSNPLAVVRFGSRGMDNELVKLYARELGRTSGVLATEKSEQGRVTSHEKIVRLSWENTPDDDASNHLELRIRTN